MKHLSTNNFRTFKSLKTISIVFLVILTGASVSFSADYFWVNGSGNWSDFTGHWATTSGGAVMHTEAPGADDDVFFDSNSFPFTEDTVTVDIAAVCRTMDWSTVTNNPEFSGFNSIEVYGSFVFSPDMTAGYSGSLLFKATDAGNIIDFSTVLLSINGLNFDGSGEWTMQSDYKPPWGQFTVAKGT
ncbi:MAG: hypothetical protein KJ607_12605, partial [Bacteroidetes bacterium]|nr:hypothetical protein [Bacteroidota bacterium]